MKRRKFASALILTELIISIATSIFVFYFKDVLKVENFANQLIIILLFVGFFITISTYILKNHITFENQEQNEEHKRNFEIVKLIADFQQKVDDDERLKLAHIKLKNLTSEINNLIDGNWVIIGSTNIDLQIKSELIKLKFSLLTTHKCPRNWKLPTNQDILKKNEKIIKENHIKIKRVFLLSENDLKEFGTIKLILKQHIAIGVDVLCVRAQKLKVDLLKDFLIFDDSKVIVEDIVQDKTEYERALITINKEDINSWKMKFNHILNNALTIEESENTYIL